MMADHSHASSVAVFLCALLVSCEAFVSTLTFLHLSFFRVLEEAVLRACGISLVSLIILMQFILHTPPKYTF